jgi:hypothetical protein
MVHHKGCCDEVKVKIGADEINSYFERCKVLIAAAYGKFPSTYLVKLWCTNRSGDRSIANYWMEFDKKGRLSLNKTDRQP